MEYLIDVITNENFNIWLIINLKRYEREAKRFYVARFDVSKHTTQYG